MALITAAQIVKGTSQAFAKRRVTPADHLLFVERMMPVAIALVDRYAAAAPEECRSESILRFIGALLESGYGAKFAGEVKPVNHGSMFRTCGAQGLLQPWHPRRAGAC